MPDMMKPHVRTSAGDNRAVNPSFGKVAQSDKAYRDQADETQREDYRKGGKVSQGAVNEAKKLADINTASAKKGQVSSDQAYKARSNAVKVDRKRQEQRGTPTEDTQYQNANKKTNMVHAMTHPWERTAYDDIKKYKRS